MIIWPRLCWLHAHWFAVHLVEEHTFDNGNWNSPRLKQRIGLMPSMKDKHSSIVVVLHEMLYRMQHPHSLSVSRTDVNFSWDNKSIVAKIYYLELGSQVACKFSVNSSSTSAQTQRIIVHSIREWRREYFAPHMPELLVPCLGRRFLAQNPNQCTRWFTSMI